MLCQCKDNQCDWKFIACGRCEWMNTRLQYQWKNGFSFHENTQQETLRNDVIRVWQQYPICKARSPDLKTVFFGTVKRYQGTKPILKDRLFCQSIESQKCTESSFNFKSLQLKSSNDKIKWVNFRDVINRTKIEITKITGLCKTDSIRYPGVISDISKNRVSCKIDGATYRSGVGGFKFEVPNVS